MPVTQGVVLVGGLGTRLGELTRTTPKPMIEVGGRPFIEHVLAHLARFGLDDLLLVAGYRGEAFLAAYHSRELFGARIRVVVEPEPMGTAGALRFVAAQLAPTFVMSNGDTFFNTDLAPLLARGGNGRSAILLRRIEDAGRYGQVEIAPDGRVTAFREKASISRSVPALISAGTYLLDRESVLEHVATLPCSIETHVLPRLAAAGALSGVEAGGYFVDMGVPESLAAARQDLDAVRRRPAAFLDRDGTLNLDRGYTHRVEDLQFVDGVLAAIAKLNRAGLYTVVVTNQGGIARGYYGWEQARSFNRALRARLMADGARIDAVYFCPHHPDGSVAELALDCRCRKPAPGLLEQAAREWPIDVTRSFLIGDMPSDVEAAHAFGIPGYRYEGGSLTAVVERALALMPEC
jgi:D-glycero-D-manno-heptose 1,7-bisphosphate phosphatase